MKLRSKLILAFLLLSVVPLSLVTFYSYRSSVKALRQAVEQEAALMAGEMGRRMEVVTTELGRRIEQLWDAPEAVEAIEAARMSLPPAADTTGHIAKLLGETAVLLDKVEIVPAPPPPPPTAPRHAAPPPPPPPNPPSGSAPMVIDVDAIVQEIKKEVAGAEGDPMRTGAGDGI